MIGTGRIRKTMITALAALALTATGAKAAFMTGEKLNEYCQQFLLFIHHQDASPVDAGICVGFVVGVWDAMSEGGNAEKVCLPRVSSHTLAEVVARYLDKHPDQRQYSGQSLVFDVLAKAYPCQK